MHFGDKCLSVRKRLRKFPSRLKVLLKPRISYLTWHHFWKFSASSLWLWTRRCHRYSSPLNFQKAVFWVIRFYWVIWNQHWDWRALHPVGRLHQLGAHVGLVVMTLLMVTMTFLCFCSKAFQPFITLSRVFWKIFTALVFKFSDFLLRWQIRFWDAVRKVLLKLSKAMGHD